METNPFVVAGVVKNGVVVPEGETKLPEGMHVSIVFSREEVPPDLRAEFLAWEKASDEAWAMIDEWEKAS